MFLQRTEEYSPLYWWWDEGKSRARLSWQVTMWPKAMIYEGLDPKGKYAVKDQISLRMLFGATVAGPLMHSAGPNLEDAE